MNVRRSGRLTVMRFHTTIELAGRTATGFAVPPEVVDALGGSRKPAVEVTINGGSYRTSVAARGDRYLVPVSAENRAVVGVAAGDVVEVDIALDTAPRDVALPDDLAAALDGDARAFYDALSFSAKQRVVLPIEQAKKPETRRSRVDKAAALLSAGRKP
jgi:hypothetical protein